MRHRSWELINLVCCRAWPKVVTRKPACCAYRRGRVPPSSASRVHVHRRFHCRRDTPLRGCTALHTFRGLVIVCSSVLLAWLPPRTFLDVGAIDTEPPQ